MLVPSALAPDGSAVDGFRFDGARVTYEGERAGRRRHPLRARAAGCRTIRDWLVPGVFYGENRPRGLHAHLPALHAGRHRRRADGVRLVELPRRPLLDARRLRRRPRPRSPRERSPLGQAGVGFALRDGRPRRLARLPLPRGAAPLRRLRDGRAAGRADAPLAAGRDGRARRARGATSRRLRPRDAVRGPELGRRRGGRGARRLRAPPLALPARSAAAASRRARFDRDARCATTCTSPGSAASRTPTRSCATAGVSATPSTWRPRPPSSTTSRGT